MIRISRSTFDVYDTGTDPVQIQVVIRESLEYELHDRLGDVPVEDWIKSVLVAALDVLRKSENIAMPVADPLKFVCVNCVSGDKCGKPAPVYFYMADDTYVRPLCADCAVEWRASGLRVRQWSEIERG